MLALLKNREYRRNTLTLWLVTVRQGFSWKFWATMILLPSIHLYIGPLAAESPRQLFDLVQATMAAVAIMIGANLFSADRKQGTFDLLWLSTGSEKDILWLRQATAMVTITLLTLACLIAVPLHPAGSEVSLIKAIILLLTTSWFLMAFAVWTTTRLPQAWTAALFALVLVALWFWYWRGSTSMFYPFINPFSKDLPGSDVVTTGTQRVIATMESVSRGSRSSSGLRTGGRQSFQVIRDGATTGQLVINRIVLLATAFFLTRSAEKRLG